MSLFQTSSSHTTLNSTDNYITFIPCRISPSVIEYKTEIYQKNRELFKKTGNVNENNYSEHGNKLEAYYQNSANKINKRILDFNFKNFSSRFSNSSKNKNEQESYENSLINRLFAAKNDAEALNVMTILWKSVKFCDLIIVTCGVQYLAHRVILALYSPKYKAYFQEHKYDFVTRIQLKESKPRALQQILRFLYSKEEIRFNIRTIDSILTCVKELGLAKLQETCEKSLDQFENKYVFELIEISSKHGLKQLYTKAFLYVSLNFNECINYSSFLNASYKLLIELLERNAIRNRNETLLFQRLFDWILKNKELVVKNPECVSRIMRNINISKIPANELKTIKNEKSSVFHMCNFDSIFNEVIRACHIGTKSSEVKRERTLSVEIPRRNSKKKDSKNDYIVDEQRRDSVRLMKG